MVDFIFKRKLLVVGLRGEKFGWKEYNYIYHNGPDERQAG